MPLRLIIQSRHKIVPVKEKEKTKRREKIIYDIVSKPGHKIATLNQDYVLKLFKTFYLFKFRRRPSTTSW